MRFHLLSLPNVQTTKAYSLDGFAMATIRFARLLKGLGHTVFLYASEENEAPCDELITTITKEEQHVLLDGCEYQYAAMESRFALWALANPRMVAEIAKRKKERDIIAVIGGTSHEPIANAHPDLMTVEYSIGYVSSFAKYRVFESHYWRAMTHGFQQAWEGRYFDAVIPLFFDPAEFQFRSTKEGFALYVGRLIPNKGLLTACLAARHAGIPLKVIGHGDPALVTHGAQYLGALPMAERNDLMSRATVLICPTHYVEPFGSVAVEAQMCGTPVVSTDFGGFVETVENGRTGYRCSYLGEFVSAVRAASLLDRHYIRARAERLYSIEAVAQQYEDYFKRLQLLWGEGWNSLQVLEC
jgi:glycosyltransferase involved in cell wall biosynthesis